MTVGGHFSLFIQAIEMVKDMYTNTTNLTYHPNNEQTLSYNINMIAISTRELAFYLPCPDSTFLRISVEIFETRHQNNSRVANVKNQHLQNYILTAVICWTTSHLNTGAVAVNSITSLGHKLIIII